MYEENVLIVLEYGDLKGDFPSTAWKTRSSHEMLLGLSSFYVENLT